jgi:plastocyanin
VETLWELAQDIWDGIIELTARFMMPDWSGLVALLPLFVAAATAIALLWLVRRWRTAPAKHRGPGRRLPAPPAGVHAPGPSWAPIFGGLGVGLLVFSLVFGGWMLVLGLIALALSMLYWLREATREYEDIEASHTDLPALVDPGPPPGVHAPGPSYRPILVGLALGVLFFGLVFGGWLLLAGVVAVVLSLFGWLRDARREYLYAVEADRTGHLRTDPDPRFPTGWFVTASVIVLLGAALQAGIIPPTSPAAGGEGSPSPSGPPASGIPSAAPSAGPTIPPGDVAISARGIEFEQASVTAPAGQPFTIGFLNLDDGVPHDVDIRDSADAKVFDSTPFNGIAGQVLDAPALAAGSYEFFCSIHPNMTGTLTAE